MSKVHAAPRVKELRSARAWSQEQLAQIATVNVRTIQRIENGEPASFETLKSLAAAFERTVSDLIRTDEKASESASTQPVGEFLLRVTTGTELFSFFGSAHAYGFSNDEPQSDEQADLIASFLQDLHDWSEIWDEIEPGERIRTAHDYTKRIRDLEAQELWVFAARSRKKYLVGDKPSIWNVLTIRVLRSDNPEIIRVDPSKAAVFAEGS